MSMKKISLKKYISIIAIYMALVNLISCADDDLVKYSNVEEGVPITVSLNRAQKERRGSARLL